MEPRVLWNEWVETFDLFVSYARKDNETGMVSALVETIEADFAHFSPSVPLKVFFDKKSILDMQHWQNVLKTGLRQSKVMLAVLSEAYFKSEWCRREWEEYILVEQARTYPGEALTPIFIVAPEDLNKVVPAAAQDWWNDVTSRNAVVEIHPFWPKGRSALQERIVVERLRQLQGNIRDRVEHGRILARVPRDIRGRNPNFVGRKQELAKLRDALSRFEMVGICAVNGVAGIGKSSMAREYAYLFRREYLGGQFEIDLSTITSMRGVQDHLVRIARDYLGAAIAPEPPEAEQDARARAAFQQLPPGQTALLILDNLNEECANIVGREQRDSALPSAEKVHLLITTRAEPRSLGGMQTVSLDILPPGDALDLLFRYRQFARDQDDPDYLRARAGTYTVTDFDESAGDAEWKAALAIVNRLGRHTLAVTLVGAYLGSYPDVSYRQFAQELATHGIGLALDAVGNDEKVRNLVEHPETLIGPLFERSVVRLSPLALRTLEYAAFLPPDLVPLAWLKQMVAKDADMTEALKPKPFQPPPWEETLRTLDGLQYLIGQPYARTHRVVQEVIRRRMSEGERLPREQAVLVFIEDHTVRIHDGDRTYSDLIEVAAVEQFVRHRSDQRDRLVGRTCMWLVSTLRNLGRLRHAFEISRLAHRILTQVLPADFASAGEQCDLLMSFIKLGETSMDAGDLAASRDYYIQALTIYHALPKDDPKSFQYLRHLLNSCVSLGDVSLAEGSPHVARDYYEQVLTKIRAHFDLKSAQVRLYLSSLLTKMGDVCLAIRGTLANDDPEVKGYLIATCGYLEQALTIRLALANEDPKSALKLLCLSGSLAKMGELCMALRSTLADDDPAVKGYLAAARDYLEQALTISNALDEDDPNSGGKQQSLVALTTRLGYVSVAEGDPAAARDYLEQALTISNALVKDDPDSPRNLENLSATLEGQGHVCKALRGTLADDDPAVQGYLAAARDYFEQALTIRHTLVKDDPKSTEKQRRLGVLHVYLFDIENKLDNCSAARSQLEQIVAVWGKLEAEGRLPSPNDLAWVKYARWRLAHRAD